MADYEVLEPGGHAHLVSDIKAYVDRAGGVGTTQIADEAVTMDKLADGAVTQEKLAQDVQQVINISGAADALMGDPSESTWTRRTSTSSGMARVESVQGAAVVWNQMSTNAGSSTTQGGVTFTNNGDGSWTVNGTSSGASSYTRSNGSTTITIVPSHKYLVKGCPETSTESTCNLNLGGTGFAYAEGTIWTNTQFTSANLRIQVTEGATIENAVFWPQLFDLTQMFGAGNEPTTVAEFERMYPASCYPYSVPTLKPVQIAGIESVGFNQWDEEWELGTVSYIDGTNVSDSTAWRSKNYIPLVAGQNYYFLNGGNYTLGVRFYDSEKQFIGSNAFTNSRIMERGTLLPQNTAYMRFDVLYQTTYNHDICLNLSDPALNGQYKPYTTDSMEWTAFTLRAAGTIGDMLYSDHVETRVGVVDLGTLTWNGSGTDTYYAQLDAMAQSGTQPVSCAEYAVNNTVSSYGQALQMADKTVAGGHSASAAYIYIKDSAYATAAALQTALNGVLLYYELDTHTTTPISPALPMSYKVEHGGTESIIVSEGEVSATPVITVTEGESAADLVMDALAAIAAPDGPTATVNHAVGTYLTMCGALYRVTTAIATGEAVVIGTNVQATTVMDEVIRLTQ